MWPGRYPAASFDLLTLARPLAIHERGERPEGGKHGRAEIHIGRRSLHRSARGAGRIHALRRLVSSLVRRDRKAE
jgi:hypothetical protein